MAIFQTALILILSVLLTCPSRLGAENESKPPKRTIYDESADGATQISNAIEMAQQQHKRVLLQFGANWCGWCRLLHDLFESDGEISGFAKSKYITALIDVNKNHNKQLISQYKAKYSLPFIVILDSDGTHLTTKQTDGLEEGNHHSPQKVLVFLKEWAQKTP